MKLLLLTIATLISISANAALVTRTTFNAATNALAAEIATKQDTIWNNSGGVISPASGQVTNVLRFTSGLADNATNVAVVVDTAEAWADGYLLDLRNDDTNLFRVSAPYGGILSSGAGSAAFLDTYWSGNPAKEGYFFTGFNNTTVGQPSSFGMFLGAGDPAVEVTFVELVGSASGDARLRLAPNGNLKSYLAPAISGTVTAYLFDTSMSHSSGDLAVIGNNGTNKVAVAWDGAVTAAQVASEPSAPAAGYYTLFAIDNGGGKMVLKVRFPTGASQTVATEP